MSKYKIHKFPKSRIATIDVCEMGKKKHHVAAFLEIDVTSGDIMNISVLIDHDVIDGGPMARFISALNKNIEAGMFL
jgi:pyruvate/2-oxoglutarate dehydrogenase complex dihydrolipoamide acyltransferase (E2) component